MCGDGNGSSGVGLVRGLTDLFVAGERGCVKEGLHGGFPEAVAALMSSGLVGERGLRTPTGRLSERFCISFILGPAGRFSFMR